MAGLETVARFAERAGTSGADHPALRQPARLRQLCRVPERAAQRGAEAACRGRWRAIRRAASWGEGSDVHERVGLAICDNIERAFRGPARAGIMPPSPGCSAIRSARSSAWAAVSARCSPPISITCCVSSGRARAGARRQRRLGRLSARREAAATYWSCSISGGISATCSNSPTAPHAQGAVVILVTDHLALADRGAWRSM